MDTRFNTLAFLRSVATGTSLDINGAPITVNVLTFGTELSQCVVLVGGLTVINKTIEGNIEAPIVLANGKSPRIIQVNKSATTAPNGLAPYSIAVEQWDNGYIAAPGDIVIFSGATNAPKPTGTYIPVGGTPAHALSSTIFAMERTHEPCAKDIAKTYLKNKGIEEAISTISAEGFMEGDHSVHWGATLSKGTGLNINVSAGTCRHKGIVFSHDAINNSPLQKKSLYRVCINRGKEIILQKPSELQGTLDSYLDGTKLPNDQTLGGQVWNVSYGSGGIGVSQDAAGKTFRISATNDQWILYNRAGVAGAPAVGSSIMMRLRVVEGASFGMGIDHGGGSYKDNIHIEGQRITLSSTGQSVWLPMSEYVEVLLCLRNNTSAVYINRSESPVLYSSVCYEGNTNQFWFAVPADDGIVRSLGGNRDIAQVENVWAWDYAFSGAEPWKVYDRNLATWWETLSMPTVTTASSNAATDLLTWAGTSGWATIQNVFTFVISANAPAPLTVGTVYYGRRINDNDFYVYPTYSDAVNQTNRVDITATLSGTISMRRTSSAHFTKLRTAYMAKCYTLTCSTTAGTNVFMPKSWILLGTNDDTLNTWTVLDSRSGQTWTTGVKKTFTFPNTVYYRTFALLCTDTQGGASALHYSLSELRFWTGTIVDISEVKTNTNIWQEPSLHWGYPKGTVLGTSLTTANDIGLQYDGRDYMLEHRNRGTIADSGGLNDRNSIGNLEYSAHASVTGKKAESYIFCTGGELNRRVYPELFWRIGTVFGSGGDGITTFNIPNAYRRFIMGSDGYSIAEYAGEESHTLTINEMPSHAHNYWNTNGATWGYQGPGPNKIGILEPTSYEGGNQAHNNMPPYFGALTMIKYK